MINLWLDDERPAPAGWFHAKDIIVAKLQLEIGMVDRMSLDHDLGEDLQTGYDLVKWCAETGHWSRQKPEVHSMNPVGRKYMLGVIDRYFEPPIVA